jgi:3,4-dihydroxy 2-butanone 4-phosphate synthase / GTP cyclohydrolase II
MIEGTDAMSGDTSRLGEVISSVDEIVDLARNGHMFILVDDEDRENEGDLIIPAQMATPDAINFMARFGRGLICLAITAARAAELGLEMQGRSNGSHHETAFTVSIEAREGVTTGISAADRARTIAVAIDASHGKDEIVSPGHVFPLVARDGGVLVRAGHTEASVDISRLAGLNASGVICEIMNADGTMARLADLIPFAQEHGLKIGTIRDLIAYRRKHDHLVERIAEGPFRSDFGGDWKVLSYRNKLTGVETMVLQKGEVSPDEPTLVRMHNLNVFQDTLGEAGDRSGLLGRAMCMIGEEGRGVVVLINRFSANVLSDVLHVRSGNAPRAAVSDLRDYGIGAQILTDIGVHDMVLLTNSHQNLVALEGYELNIVGERPIA